MARLTILVPSEVAAGFRLAGVGVVEADDAAGAAASLERLVADPEVGVIGVHASLLAGMDAARRRKLEDLVAPVVVSVPAGHADTAAGDHRARLASLLQRAIGFRISFGEGDEP